MTVPFASGFLPRLKGGAGRICSARISSCRMASFISRDLWRARTNVMPGGWRPRTFRVSNASKITLERGPFSVWDDVMPETDYQQRVAMLVPRGRDIHRAIEGS